jgi:hypothetical protein
MLPLIDQEYVRTRAAGSTVSLEAGMICVVIPRLLLPKGFTVAEADLLLRLAPGYPDVPPDMWWFQPAVLRVDGCPITATQVQETHLGRVWQRWSRHLQSGQWRSGIDSLESYLALVRRELDSAARMIAA